MFGLLEEGLEQLTNKALIRPPNCGPYSDFQEAMSPTLQRPLALSILATIRRGSFGGWLDELDWTELYISLETWCRSCAEWIFGSMRVRIDGMRSCCSTLAMPKWDQWQALLLAQCQLWSEVCWGRSVERQYGLDVAACPRDCSVGQSASQTYYGWSGRHAVRKAFRRCLALSLSFALGGTESSRS